MSLPDSPKMPKFMQLLQWIYNPLQLMEASQQTCGDFFTLWLTNKQPMVFMSNPQAIQEIFTTHLENLDSRASAAILQPLLGDNSLLLLSGKTHQRQRKLLTPSFHGDRMRAYGDLITQLTKNVISKWQIGEPFSVSHSMKEITLQVILKAVFGLHEGDRYNQLQTRLCSILGLSSSSLRATLSFIPALRLNLGRWSPWGNFLYQREEIDKLLYAEIQERRNHPDPSRNDILSLMMSARDENGELMTDVELRDELMTLLVAGHETTASALTWALYWIHHLPSVREKLLAELDSFHNADLNEITRLPYLNAVCQETLRIYPIAMITIPRIVKSPIEIMGHKFAPGTMLLGCIYLIHHRPDLYPQPDKFQPERFLEKQYSFSEYLPFGGGNRRCLGMAFALFEMKLVLATVLSQMDLKLVENYSVKPIRRGVTLAPSSGKWLIATGQRQKAEKSAIQV
ncbi:cytochrome P450 [Calothrix sp. NIES-2100]|uniref:cytochrome P450 n=1 Tax=Calothrix sp. NIES-2100 TaxID=1954172 RepID=UPI000B601A99|nr:cytochrome P450 [Calothrix sp. NIES-2100]